MKLKDGNCQGLSKEIQKNHPKSMAHKLQEFKQVSGTDVSINAILKEAHLLGFHGRAAPHNPLITKSNGAFRLRWRKGFEIGS
ncbi:hypothetical protein TNCV_1975421 [Trichonephila clavipes]|nr:hypothetical protein TNCV_1975421 [Trichonephila clavipes]